MKMDVLHCKTVAGVKKELTIFMLVYNLVRVVMLEAAQRQRVPVARISFKDAADWLRHGRPGAPLPKLVVHPRRPERLEPRALKRRGKPYHLMNRPRGKMRQELLEKTLTA